MKLKQKTIALGSLFFLSVCSSYGKPLSDPFLQEWDFFNGVNKFKLTITPSAAPGQDYHIAYTYPGGESATDMCKATSSNAFQCLTGETVTRDDNQHLVKLNDRGTVYIFYDPKHMPPNSSIFGKWHFQYKYDQYGSHSLIDYTITITRGTNDSEYNINTNERSNDGSSGCSNDIYDAYRVTNNPDGTQTVSNGTGHWESKFKLDPKKMQITSPNPDHSLNVGMCVDINADMAAVVEPIFTKEP